VAFIPWSLLMKALPALFLFVSTSAFAQFSPTPGIPAAAQASQAYGFSAGQAATMHNQWQVNSMVATQAAMIANPEARAMYMGMAAGLQAQHSFIAANNMAANHMAMSLNTNALMLSMMAAQNQRYILSMNAVRMMRSVNAVNASAASRAVQLASFDPTAQRHTRALLSAAMAQAAAQAPGKVPPAPDAADAAPSPMEAPPMNIRPTFGAIGVGKPKFSTEGGKVPAGTQVKIHTDTHYATLYYTTNGWTPTTQSARYTGPLTINKTTHLQVMAVGPNFMRSQVEQIDYVVEGSKEDAPETTVEVPADGTLKTGTPMRLVFGGKEISSETATLGDPITVLLDEDIKQGDEVLAPKGAEVRAVLTNADAQGSGAPGDLVFEVRSIEVKGKRVPLFGGETLEGKGSGITSKNVTIKPGMTFIAFVATDTRVK
jgi:hypothetical protein